MSSRLLFGGFAVALLSNIVLNISIDNGTLPVWLLWAQGVVDIRGIVFVFIVLALLYGITRLPVTSATVVIALATLVSVVNFAKMKFLLLPLLPSDLGYLGEFDLFVGLINPLWFVLLAAILIVVLLSAIRRDLRSIPELGSVDGKPRRRILFRLSSALLLVALAFGAVRFHEPHNPVRFAVESSGIEWVSWSPLRNAAINGFVASTLYNMPTTGVQEPEDYGAQRMQEVIEDYSDTPSSTVHHHQESVEPWNIVLVLSESLGRIQEVPGLHLASNPTPKLDHYIATNQGGTILADQYGGGTSNMEMQVLTGASTGFFAQGVSSGYQSFLADLESIPSLSSWLKDSGYEVHGMLADLGDRYKRPAVYERMGFDSFESLKNMRYTGKIGNNWYVSDEQVFKGVLETIEESEEPMLVHALTMQNHIPIGDWYDDPIEVTGDIDAESVEEIGMWARGAAHSDDALSEFLKQLEELDEPTAVIYYGDHFPSIMSPELLKRNDDLTFRTTPALLWSNQDTDFEPEQFERQSASALVPRLYRMLGLDLPPYYEFLLRVEEELGVVIREGVYTEDGEIIREEDLTPKQEKLYDDYHLIQYDFSVGERYALDELWFDWDPMAEAQDSPP